MSRSTLWGLRLIFGRSMCNIVINETEIRIQYASMKFAGDTKLKGITSNDLD